MRMNKPKKGFEKLTKEKARVVAHLIGDGAHYKTGHDYVLKYEVLDKESLNQFFHDVHSVFGIEPSREWNVSGKTGKQIPFIRLRSKLAYEDLGKYATYPSASWRIKTPLLESSDAIKKEFLRALFDDEASVTNGLIKLYSTNHSGLRQIQRMIMELGIPSRIQGGYGERRNVHALIIKDLKPFQRKIGFNLARKSSKLADYIREGVK